MKTKILFLVTVLFLAGCAAAPSNVQKIDKLEAVGDDPRIVLMPPDVRYYLVTAGGVPEPHEEWTTAAQTNFVTAAEAYAQSIGADLRTIDKDNLSEDEIRYETLHSAVGGALLTHYFGGMKLPSKGENFDWSLGPGVASIGQQHDADYALFVHYRDYQASGGRVAFAILAAAAGVGVPMGGEMGFASLVDLKSGDIVWFNRVIAGSGELRKPDGAAATVNGLLAGIPTSQGSGSTE